MENISFETRYCVDCVNCEIYEHKSPYVKLTPEGLKQSLNTMNKKEEIVIKQTNYCD